MLQIENIKLALDEDEALLPRKAAAALGVPASEIGEVRVLRRAIDAREGVRFVYTLQAAVKKPSKVRRNRGVFPASEEIYRLPSAVPAPRTRPVVVGAGPGGLFCALALAR